MTVARAALIAGAVVLLASGCTAQPPVQQSTPIASSSATPTATPSVAAYDAAGGAADNKAFFAATTRALLTKKPTPTGRQLVDNLVEAGFDKSAMEVTPDKTSIGLDADAIEFSVKFDDGCLVGQQASFGFTVVELPVLDTDTCLVGKTRAIDW